MICIGGRTSGRIQLCYSLWRYTLPPVHVREGQDSMHRKAASWIGVELEL
jgi:hypothetical protein